MVVLDGRPVIHSSPGLGVLRFEGADGGAVGASHVGDLAAVPRAAKRGREQLEASTLKLF